MRILIYADEGVSSLSLQETLRTFRKLFAAVETVDSHILNETDWEEETALLVIPGGRDIPYDRHLKGKGTAKIRRFVEDGGSYLGICAGGYFGAREVIFEKGTAIEVDEKRELRFFPGAAVGTLYPHAPFSYNTEEGTHASHIRLGKEDLYLYYNGGCAFKNADKYPKVSILARYADAEDQAAIVHCKVGKGNAILTGVHVEIDPTSLKKEGGAPRVIKTLKQSNQKRETLMISLINRLLE